MVAAPFLLVVTPAKQIPLRVYFTTFIMVYPYASPLVKVFTALILSWSIVPFAVAQDLYTADGLLLGDQQVFIDACVQGAQEKTIDLQGVTFNMERYCSCMATELMPKLNSDEIIKAVENNSMEKLLMQGNNMEVLMSCVEGNVKVGDDFVFDKETIGEAGVALSIEQCAKEMMTMDEVKDVLTEAQARVYCKCAIERMATSGTSYGKLKEIEDESSVTFNELAVPCMNEALDGQSVVKSDVAYNEADIRGDMVSDVVELIDYLGSGYKVKLVFGGVEKYFLFDTGASSVFINRDTERELLIEGVLTKESYTGKELFAMANGDMVKAETVLLNGVRIGGYVVDNVPAAILEEGMLLCGTGLLDKFKKWEVDKDALTVTLFR